MTTLLDTLCPMHLQLDATGHIRHCGPALARLRPDCVGTGQRFLERFELRRPRGVTTMTGLMAHAGKRLQLAFRDPPQTTLKGVAAPLPEGAGAVVNLSFGISVLSAVRDYALTSADFAATDLAVELLYLVEAKSVAMEASRHLNLRLQGARIAAEEQAFTDTLTGLKNRRALDHVLARLTEAGRAFGLMHLDLDFFKAVNDTLGHAAGDHVLQQAARIMVSQTRDEDLVARIGGDEFVLLFDATTSAARLQSIAKRLIAQLEQPIPYGYQSCLISASIGIVTSSDPVAASPDALLQAADLALYAAKAAGRGCCRLYAPGLISSPARSQDSSATPRG